MAFGTSSAVFGAFLTDTMNAAKAFDLDTHTLKLALYNNSQPTNPNRADTAANTAYGAGIWVNTYEVTDTGGWAAGGRAINSPTPVTSSFTGTSSAGTYTFDAADLVSGTITVGISNAYGCLIYDTQTTTTLNQGVCFLAFGGAVSAPSGTLTIQFNAAGIFTITF